MLCLSLKSLYADFQFAGWYLLGKCWQETCCSQESPQGADQDTSPRPDRPNKAHFRTGHMCFSTICVLRYLGYGQVKLRAQVQKEKKIQYISYFVG